MDTENGTNFIKHLAHFVRTHEKALANALQLQRKQPRPASTQDASASAAPSSSYLNSNALAAALSLPYLSFGSNNVQPVKLTLTPHHLFYLLSRFEELGILVGPMNVRLENINNNVLPGNYVSFLGKAPRSRGRSDADSIHSVASVRSAISSMSSMWAKLGLSNDEDRLEKQKAVEKDDLRYLYSAFTKIPCLRLAPDHRSKLIAGYEEFPFDTAVPLFAFKNLSALEVCDVDFRQLYGWDRLAEQLRSLTIKRGCIEDITDLLVHIVLDDMDKRRRLSAKQQVPSSPAAGWPAPSPSARPFEPSGHSSVPASPLNEDRRLSYESPPPAAMARLGSAEGKRPVRHVRQRSQSPARPVSSRQIMSQAFPPRSVTPQFRRSSGSSSSSVHSTPRTSSSNLPTLGALMPSKWRFLKHLSLADNAMTSLAATGLAPLAGTLHSLDLSSNLFTEIPESLASLTNLRALNLSNCMIAGLHSLARNPLPAITVINLHSNRLTSLAGIERMPSLERVDLRENRLVDPTELARLTRSPDMQQVYVYPNPFTRTHTNYRVTIFNLFRSSPGYTEDILVDGTGPSYNEKKQLVDRAIEVSEIPTPRTKDTSPMPPPSERPNHRPSAVKCETSPTRRSSTPDTVSRRKAPRRRIVELSLSTPPSPDKPSDPSKAASASEAGPLPRDPLVTPTHDKTAAQTSLAVDTLALSPTSSRATPDLVTDEDSPVKEPSELYAASDVYRQKMRALKTELGNDWLKGMGGENWTDKKAGQEPEYSPVPTNRSPLSESRTITVGTRTLG